MPTITIKIDRNNQLWCDPMQQEADVGDMIEWVSEFDFAIHFGIRSPFSILKTHGNRGRNPKHQVNYNPATGGVKVFKYTVAVWDSKMQEVKIIDPEIIIPPLGLGGTP
jgi:hypothetical protein